MRLRHHLEQEPAKRTKPRKRVASGSILKHKVFVPMLTAWGGALMGLSVIVLPDALIARMAVLSGFTLFGSLAKFLFAAIAAALGAGLAFVVAAALRDSARSRTEAAPVLSVVKGRRIHPINPAQDLGSESLDAPIEEMSYTLEDDESEGFEPEGIEAELPDPESAPSAKREPTLGELAARGFEIEEPKELAQEGGPQPSFTRSHFKTALIESCEGATCEAAVAEEAGEPDEKPAIVGIKAAAPTTAAPSRQPLGRPGSHGAWSLTQFSPPSGPPVADTPRELDLAEFAELPGRNAVWVEEEATPPASPPRPAAAPASALEKLRQTPPEDLSLVQMVERFAAALHEHQQKEHARPPRSGPARDAALAEALKALTLFTERGFDQRGMASEANDLSETERELRDALAKLQTLRGAA